ncbi:uncharacterized protein BJ212DRAFT_1301423, partial [Suillus subaureus]
RVTKNGETLRRHGESAKRWRILKERMAKTEKEMEVVRKILTGGDVTRSETSSTANGSCTEPSNKFYEHSFAEHITTEEICKEDRRSCTVASGPRHSLACITRIVFGVKRLFTITGSTKVEGPDLAATIKPTPPRRPNAKSVLTPEYAPLVPSTPSRRSLSRSSNASSRPWSPVTSSASTNPSIPPLPPLRPPSRAQTPSLGTTPRPRPKTPSQIPAPALHWRPVSMRQPDTDDEEELTTLMQRAFSPPHTNTSPSTFRSHTQSGVRIPPPRPPSRSQIPLPSVHVSSESRPSSTMSFYRPQSPLTPGSLLRAQTPDSQLKAKAQQVPFYGGAGNSGIRASARQTVAGKLPPSSFRDSSTTRTPNSRPGSRSGSYTPMERDPLHSYVPASDKDPLDMEVAAIVNAIPHGLLVERVDPPLKFEPESGNLQADDADALWGKGGRDVEEGCWQDLQLYMLNRQAGM